MKPDLLQKAADFVRSETLFFGGEKVLVTCSGGPDSVALLFVLKELSRRMRLKLGVAHLNHQLRSVAKKDAEFVKKLSKRLNLPLFYSEADVKAVAQENKWSLEEAGRNLRYQFFEQVAREEKFDKIATAHNADDLAETVLLQIIRGSGGPVGIPVRRGKIIRPILWATRQEVLEYLRQGKIRYRTDFSNKDKKFLRNRVRLELLPLLEKHYNPKIRLALIRLAGILEEEKNHLQAEAGKILKKAAVRTGETLSLNTAALKKAPPAIQREVFQAACSRYFDFNPDFAATGRLLGLIEKRGKIELAKNLFAQSTPKGILWFYRGKTKKTPIPIGLPEKGTIQVAGLALTGRKIPRSRIKSLFLPDGWQGYFDAGRLKPPYMLRPVENGDRFVPLGMSGNKKVGDFFTNAKVPVFQRQGAWVLTSAGKIFWLVGHQISDHFKVGPKTKEVIHLKARENG